MKSTARDIMTTTYHTLSPTMSFDQALRGFREASEKEKQSIFGMMVLDENQNLVGVLTIFDILLYIRPKHTQIWGMMEDIDFYDEIIEVAYAKAEAVLVEDIMTSEVITVTPNTHKFMIMDLMVKKHIRRIPVVEDGKVLGIIYLADLFYDLLDKCASTPGIRFGHDV